MKYKAIIFDMDGTIIDTEHIWKQANRMLIEKRGIVMTDHQQEELSKKLSGLAMAECCRIIKEHFNLEDDLELLVQEKAKMADGFYEKGVRFITGFQEFHDKAAKLNLKIGLATNATDRQVSLTDKSLNLKQFFGEHIYNISHVNNKFKPHPDIYLHAAKQLGVDPSECIAIEDSTHGVQAALNAGMFCIGINTAKRAERIAHSHLIIDHYHEINLEELLELEIKKD